MWSISSVNIPILYCKFALINGKLAKMTKWVRRINGHASDGREVHITAKVTSKIDKLKWSSAAKPTENNKNQHLTYMSCLLHNRAT